MSKFWNNVKATLRDKNTKQEWLAGKLGINQRTLEGWIFHDRIPDAESACKIAQALGTTVEYLVTGVSSNAAETELAQLKQKLLDLGKNG